MELKPRAAVAALQTVEQHMPKSLKTSPVSKTEVQWKYVRNLFFGQKVLDELRILMRLSSDAQHAAERAKDRSAVCMN